MPEAITRSFTIAFTARSGSNAICNLLERNGLGAPNEWFQAPPVAYRDEPPLDAFARVIGERGVGGVFGSKMSHDHRAALDEFLRKAIPGYSRLDDVMPNHRWVQLTRKDKLLQAISLCQAELSGQWAETEVHPRCSATSEYDFLHILSRLGMIQNADLAWELYFQQHNIEPLSLIYEDFFDRPQQELQRLIDYLGGLPKGRTSLDMGQRFKIQRHEMSHALRQRFISDFIRVGESRLAEEMGVPWDRWVCFFKERQWRLPR